MIIKSVIKSRNYLFLIHYKIFRLFKSKNQFFFDMLENIVTLITASKYFLMGA